MSEPSLQCRVYSLRQHNFPDELCIVTEYAQNGDMVKLVEAQKGKLIGESAILDWLVQLCLALLYVHKKKLLHRDLKLQNIFLDKNNCIKLGDFGIARVLQHTFECAQTVTGTPYYLAPEVCESKPYNHKADVWSMGICLYEMAAQRRAFDGSSMSSLIRRILRGKYKPLPGVYSKNLRGLVNLCLSPHPGQRPTISAILQLPFLQPYVEAFVRRCHAEGKAVPHISIAGSSPGLPPPASVLSQDGHAEKKPSPVAIVPGVGEVLPSVRAPARAPAPAGGMLRGPDPPVAQAAPAEPEAVQLAGTVIIRDEPPQTPSGADDDEEVQDTEEVTLNVKRFMDDGDGDEQGDQDDAEFSPQPKEQQEQLSPKERTQRIIREAAADALPAHLKMLVELPKEHASKSYRLQTLQHFLSMDLGEDLFHCVYEAIVRPNRGKEPYVVRDLVRQVMTARGEKLSLASDQLLHDLIQQEQDIFQ